MGASKYSTLIFTLNEYKTKYDELLENHLKLHIDYDTKHFINAEIFYYKFHIEFINNIGAVPEELITEDLRHSNIVYENELLKNVYLKDVDSEILEEFETATIIKNLIGLSFDECVFFLHNTKNSFYLIIDFLISKKKELKISKNGKNIEHESIDLSDTSTTEKIIYLQKLGVIDFLKKQQPFLSSTNSLATVLSAVTGAKAGTIQSMINPILSKKVDDKNNPMNSIKPVSKVQKQLNDIGFNLNETN